MDKELNSLIGMELYTDQNNDIITDGLEVTVVLHIR